MCKSSWEHCDCTKQMLWRNCTLQTSDICRSRQVMRAIWGAAFLKGAFELKDVHLEVRTDFHISHWNGKLKKYFQFNGVLLTFLSSKYHSIYWNIHTTNTHIDYRRKLPRVPLLLKKATILIFYWMYALQIVPFTYWLSWVNKYILFKTQ